MDLDDLRKQIASGQITLQDDSTSILKGSFFNHETQKDVDFEIFHGWNIIYAMQCDRNWGAFTLKLLKGISDKNYSEDELNEVLSKVQLEDSHWDWFKKSIGFTGDEYEWFYLTVDNKPEGACLIYHPKESAIDNSNNIFYIEFVAVAPWNRGNPLYDIKFKGVGTKLIQTALKYSVDNLGLVYGFSLHSLPQAAGYYEHLGMIGFDGRDKGRLAYYELPKDLAESLAGLI